MMNKLSFVGQLSKTLGYVAFALNNVIRFAGNTTQRITDKITSIDRYNIEILVNGATMVEHKNQSAAQLSRLLTTMDNFGVTEVIITKKIKADDVSSDTKVKD
tara:strand:- start:1436 stop:1744 length:309 start_codon:yes stop_codon:yes gene_type:complete